MITGFVINNSHSEYYCTNWCDCELLNQQVLISTDLPEDKNIPSEIRRHYEIISTHELYTIFSKTSKLDNKYNYSTKIALRKYEIAKA